MLLLMIRSVCQRHHLTCVWPRWHWNFRHRDLRQSQAAEAAQYVIPITGVEIYDNIAQDPDVENDPLHNLGRHIEATHEVRWRLPRIACSSFEPPKKQYMINRHV